MSTLSYASESSVAGTVIIAPSISVVSAGTDISMVIPLRFAIALT